MSHAARLHFSANPSKPVSAKGRALLARLPQHRVLCEPDGPYTRRAGRLCRPADLPAMVEDFARLWNVSMAQANAQICANQRRITGE